MSAKRKLAKTNPTGSRRAVIETLEPRLLLSAGLEAFVIHDEPVQGEALLQSATEAELVPQSDVTDLRVEAVLRQELVFVDTDTPDYEQLLNDLLNTEQDDRQFEVILLDNDQNGIDQISETLASRGDIDAIHIISHGADGTVDLGNTRLEFDTLLTNAKHIANWSEALTADADLLLYGCDLAATSEGQSLVNALAQLTGADVAASDDLTGNTEQGGDWELEYTVGEVEAQVAISKQMQQQWDGTLADVVLESNETTGVLGEIKSDQIYAQEFVHNSVGATYEVNEIEVRLVRDLDIAADNQTITVSLRSTSWDGPVLGSASMSSNDLTDTEGWYNFDIGSVLLNNNQNYFIQIVSDSTNGKVYIGIDAGASYTSGELFKDGGSEGTDAAFRVIQNTPPVPQNDNYTIDEDTTLNSNVLSNDTDPESDTLTVNTTPVVDVSNGSLTLNADGSFTYTPNANFNGSDSFVYEVDDGSNNTAQATVTITVNPVNDVPVAANDSYSVDEDQTLYVVNALTDKATATDLEALWLFNEGTGSATADATANSNDGTVNGATWATSSRTGNAALSFDGTNDYVQTTNTTLDLSTATNFTLSAWFQADTTTGAHHIIWQGVSGMNGWGSAGSISPATSEIHLSVGHQDFDNKISFFLGYDNDHPDSIEIVSASDFTDTTAWHHAVVVVTDIGGGTLQAELYVDGVLEGSDTGTQNDRSQWNTDLRIGMSSSTRQFDGLIDEVGVFNTALTPAEIAELYKAGVIVNDTDADGDILTVNTTPVTDVSNGTLTLNSDGSFIYTPNANFNGTDSFTYEVSDGNGGTDQATVTITVNSINDVPEIDLDANDDSGATGRDFITSFFDGDPAVNITDSDVSLIDVDDNLTSITVTLTNNLEPGGNKELLTANSATLTITGNGTDTLTISGAGTVADYLAALSTVQYQNTQNNPDTTDRIITFVADDGIDTSLVATTTIRVFLGSPGNDEPVAIANTVTTAEDTPFAFSSTDFTFVDIEGDALVSATITNQALAGGTLTYNGGTTVNDGDTLTALELDTLIYTPAGDANAAPLATFDFAVNDADPGTVFAQMDIDVTPVNDVPVNTVPGAQVVDEDTVLNLGGISISDVDGDLDTVALSVSNGTLTVTLSGGASISAGSNASASLTLSGNVTDINATLASLAYQGNTDFNGADVLTIVTTDTNATSDTDTVNITVNAVNDAPVANDDNYSVSHDQTLIINAMTDNATAADLAAAWQFDEGAGTTTTDATDNGNDGTINGATWTGSSRTGDAALSFDGTNDYVQTTNTTLDLSTATNFTLSAWFQTDTTTGAHHILWQGVSTQNGWGDPGDNTPTSSEMNLTVGRYDANDKITFFLGYDVNDANSIDITSASNFTDTAGWHHAVVVVTDLGGGTLQADLYIDGVHEGSDTGTQIDRSQWDSDLRVGSPGASTRYFDGMIDEVGIYDRALTPAEIAALYSTGIIANDTDAEGDALSAVLDTGPANGTVSLNSDGSFTYTPTAGFVGTDTFTYHVNDGGLDSNIATVTIDVTNTAPVATNDPGEFNTTINSYSPESYWRFDTSTDDGSAGNDATVNGATLGQPGAINGDTSTAISFDGVNDYVEIAHDNAYMLDDGNVQLWFNASDVSTQQGLFSKDSSGFDNGGHLTIQIMTDGSIQVRLQSDTASYYVNSAASSLTVGTWHHVAFSFGSSGMELFLDGVSVDTNAYTGGLGATSGGSGNDEPIAIGGNTMNSDNGSVLAAPEPAPRDLFTGSIDEVAIIGQALTTTQIQSLYASGRQNYTMAEDTALVVSAAEGVLINDFDAEGDALTASLVSGPSNAASFTLNADGSFNYTPVANFSGTDTFTYQANDGNDNSNIATVTITINGDNDAPVNTVPGTQTVDEDTQTAIPGISVSDPDAGANNISTQLSVTNGVLDVTLAGSATISAGANSSSTLTINGNVTDINNTLATLQYTGNTNVNGVAADTLTVVTNDLGNTGSGGAQSDTEPLAGPVSRTADRASPSASVSLAMIPVLYSAAISAGVSAVS